VILGRIRSYVRAQDWTAVVLELVIVVLGVFIGMQVSNWNDERAARVAEREFVRTIRDDIEQGIIDSRGFVSLLSAVVRNGKLALESVDAEAPCESDCWRELQQYFFASQWIDVRTNRATYDEMKRTGLPRDPALKATLTRYYGLTEQVTIIASELPRFRELIRSIIPFAVQEYMWAECMDIDGRQQLFMEGCTSPLSDREAREIGIALRENSETRPTLTFWLSTVTIVMKALADQNTEGEELIDALDRYIGQD